MQHDYLYPSHPEVVQGPFPAPPGLASDLAPEVAPESGPEVVRPYSTLEAAGTGAHHAVEPAAQFSTLEYIGQAGQHSTLEYIDQPGQHSTLEHGSQPAQRPSPDGAEKVAVDAEAKEITSPSQAGDKTTAAPPPWYRRRWALVLMAIGLVAVAAIAIGCGVGLTRKNGSASDSGYGPPFVFLIGLSF